MKIKELQLNGSNNYKQTENELGAEYYCLFLKELKLFSKLKLFKLQCVNRWYLSRGNCHGTQLNSAALRQHHVDRSWGIEFKWAGLGWWRKTYWVRWTELLHTKMMSLSLLAAPRWSLPQPLGPQIIKSHCGSLCPDAFLLVLLQPQLSEVPPPTIQPKATTPLRTENIQNINM